MNILIAGDFCPKNRIADIISTTNRDDILHNVAPIIRNCDLSVVNLECPIVNTNAEPIIKEGPHLKCAPIAAQVLKEAGFSMTTLANNHILDYGQVGLQETIQTLDAYKIAHVGAGLNLQEAQKIYYSSEGKQTVAIINCCEHEFSIASETEAGANPLNPIQQWKNISKAKQKTDYVIVIIHGGHEHYSLPSPRMQETYRFFVDAGADAVINHHQHCFSGYEVYNGKPIFYGLGNFCFDWEGKQNSPWNYGFMVELHLDEKIEFILHPYEQCNQTPDVHQLDEEQKKHFEEEIIQLNTIIASPLALKEHHEQWMEKEAKEWLISLSPVSNRYIKALMRRNLLPLCLSKKKLVALLNKVDCEAHRDKLSYILSKYIRD